MDARMTCRFDGGGALTFGRKPHASYPPENQPNCQNETSTQLQRIASVSLLRTAPLDDPGDGESCRDLDLAGTLPNYITGARPIRAQTANIGLDAGTDKRSSKLPPKLERCRDGLEAIHLQYYFCSASEPTARPCDL